MIIASFILVGIASHALSSDVPFDQDIAFRATYSDQGKIADWAALPFSALAPKDSTIHLSASDCFVAVQGNNLYTSHRADKVNKLALKQPFSSWNGVYSLTDSDNTLIQSLHERFDLFVVSSGNIIGIKLSSHDCGKVLNEQKVLPNDVAWGKIHSVASSATHLWVASTGLGLTQVRISDGTMTQIELSDMSIRSMQYVPQWNKLYVGTETALYTLNFAGPLDSSTEYLLHHEWITGVIDSVPLQFSFDTVNNALWLAESGAVHKLDTQGRWWRHGYHQGAPFGNISSVSVVNGYVYVGSQLGLARMKSTSNPAQVDTLSKTDERCNLLIDVPGSPETTTCSDIADPWVWSYYAGHRYLPDNEVYSIVASTPAEDSTVVLVTTSTGTTFLETASWTLTEKSAAFEQFQYPRHDRRKLTANCGLNSYGDLGTYYYQVGDNDGLWTAMHAIGEAYNYATTGSQLARKEAWRAFEGLEMLQNVTGAFPTFPARSYCYVEDNDAGCGSADGDDRWHNSTTYEGVVWKGDTSSDEMNGHYAALAVLYDLVAITPGEKQRVYTIIDGLTQGLLDNDLYLIDPSTGQPTTWGFWNPKEVNGDPEHYSERGLNSLEICAYLSTAYSVTRRAVYKDTFLKLITEHGYLLNTMNVKIDNPDDDNHSDNELITLAFHALFYSWQRISAEAEPDFKVHT